MNYIAHKDEADRIQTAQEHCINSAEFAGKCLSNIGMGQTAYLAGLLHDMGKFTSEFSDYITNGGRRGSVNHTFAGVREVLLKYHKEEESFENVTAELIAYAIGAHHGLFDIVDEFGNNGFYHRLFEGNVSFDEASENFHRICASQNRTDELFSAACEETKVIFEKISVLSERDQSGGELLFYLGLTARLLLSAVIEGDRRDTAEFFNGSVENRCTSGSRELWSKCLSDIEIKIGDLRCITPIEKARREISEKCRAFAEKPGKVYSLNVPTGAGKTLSSLRYAVAHAERYGKKRIIFTSPLLSILEQNADVIRKYIGNDSIIIEHHSNVVSAKNEKDELNNNELFIENWEAPVVITTLVQLLNTMFDGTTTAVRRFHSLTDSVIVIDEVQSVPNKLMTLFNLTLNYLTTVCNATVLLCSATQPCREKVAHPLLCEPEPLVPYDPKIWDVFKRTEITNAGVYRLEDIPAFALNTIDNCSSLLIICNKKSESEYLYKSISNSISDCFHLSAAMCAEHRRYTINNIKQALNSNKKVVCVSTQVIEAGVDISFGCVIRLSAGMDSVIQAAGRCNRNGESDELAKVYLLSCADESLDHLTEIREAKNATEVLLADMRNDENLYDGDLSSDAAIKAYYGHLYSYLNKTKKGWDDYPSSEKRKSLFEMLSFCGGYSSKNMKINSQYTMNQSFKTAGSLFSVFDDNTESVVVPYGEGKKIIEQMCSERAKIDMEYWSELTERAKRFTVSVREYQLNRLRSEGALISVRGVTILNAGYYDNDTGFTTEKNKLEHMEV